MLEFYVLVVSHEQARYDSKVRHDNNLLYTSTTLTKEHSTVLIGYAMSDHVQARHRLTKGHEAFACLLALTSLACLGGVHFVAPPSMLADKEKGGRPRHTLTNSISTEVGAATADPQFNAGLVTDIAMQTTDQPDNPRHYLFPRYALEQPHDPDELATRDQPPPAIPRSSAEASPTPHGDALQLHQTKPTQKDCPQILQQFRPYDTAAI
ncbi:hypothetical protein EDB83DRAFT_2312083 [Lactarius deliciosus]|nr:hypothetical protein EDB83DRAFT_2312083 [Lactarius deliciosus]